MTMNHITIILYRYYPLVVIGSDDQSASLSPFSRRELAVDTNEGS
jgi:hypothetical protein